MWSDGSPLTSKDVLFSWKLGANPKMSYNSGLWTNVVGMTDWQKGPDYSKDFTGITAVSAKLIMNQIKIASRRVPKKTADNCGRNRLKGSRIT